MQRLYLMSYVLNNRRESKNIGVKCKSYIGGGFERKIERETLLHDYKKLN